MSLSARCRVAGLLIGLLLGVSGCLSLSFGGKHATTFEDGDSETRLQSLESRVQMLEQRVGVVQPPAVN